MPRPSSHNQYSSRKLVSTISLAGGATGSSGAGSGGCTAGAGLSTGGAGASTGAAGAGAGGGGTALGKVRLALATFFFTGGTACSVAGCSATAGCSAVTGCSATASGAGVTSGAGATSGAGGVSAAAITGAGAASETFSGLVAQADKARAEKSNAKGTATLSFFDKVFSLYTVGDMSMCGIFPQSSLNSKQSSQDLLA